MIIWSQLEKGYRRQRNPTRAWNLTSSPQTTSLDSATATTWLEAKWAKSIHVCGKTHSHSMLDLGHGADRQWNVNVCMLTNSTALWMGFVITPHHACCIGPVSGPNPSPSLHLSPSLSAFLLPSTLSTPPHPPISPPLTAVPLGQSCGHTTWLLAAQECSWQKQPEARHVEKIQSAHSIHSTPHPTTSHFLPLSNWSTGVFPSSAHLWRKMAGLSSCLAIWESGYFCVCNFAATVRGCRFKQPCKSACGCTCVLSTLSLPHSERCRQFLFVWWVAHLVSCNIKLAVSESSQLSVSLVVLACRAAHLCLLDKTPSTLPRENILSPLLFFFSSSLPCLLFYFVSFYHSLCLSFFLFPFLNIVSFLFNFSLSHFLKSTPTSLPELFSLLSCTVYFSGFLPCFCFSTILLFPSLSFPAVRFDFELFWDLFCHSFEFEAKEAVVFIFSLHLDEHTHELACTAAGWLIETCVSKLLMFTEALYCR